MFEGFDGAEKQLESGTLEKRELRRQERAEEKGLRWKHLATRLKARSGYH